MNPAPVLSEIEAGRRELKDLWKRQSGLVVHGHIVQDRTIGRNTCLRKLETFLGSLSRKRIVGGTRGRHFMDDDWRRDTSGARCAF